MTKLIPYQMYVHFRYRAIHWPDMPASRRKGAQLAIPKEGLLDTFADLDDRPDFTEIRCGWNDHGIGFSFLLPAFDRKKATILLDQPTSSTGISLWLDTRGDRTGHRATRTCHHFHIFPFGPEDDTPSVGAFRIARALVDAPLPNTENLILHCTPQQSSQLWEIFLPATELSGYHPAEFSTCGVFWRINHHTDTQLAGTTEEYPYDNDPSLWHSLELVPPAKS
ncbi:MAG: hypothetical protein R3B84_12075 [Zavarzinella sp.]